MEKFLNYRELVRQTLEQIIGVNRKPQGERMTRLVMDTVSDVYMYVYYGWHKREYIHAVYIQIDIIDDKIWIQRNYTEHEIVDVLLAAGVPNEDIVLGFVAPYMREATPFAQG